MLCPSKLPTSAMGRLTPDSYFPASFTPKNFRSREASIPMIGRPRVDTAGAVKLFEQDNKSELVLKR
jgi:hypothetical protein